MNEPDEFEKALDLVRIGAHQHYAKMVDGRPTFCNKDADCGPPYEAALKLIRARLHKDALIIGRQQEIIEEMIFEAQQKFEDSEVGKELVAYRLLELEFPEIIKSLRTEAAERNKVVYRARKGVK